MFFLLLCLNTESLTSLFSDVAYLMQQSETNTIVPLLTLFNMTCFLLGLLSFR